MLDYCQLQQAVALEWVRGASFFQGLVLNPTGAAGLGSLGIPSGRTTWKCEGCHESVGKTKSGQPEGTYHLNLKVDSEVPSGRIAKNPLHTHTHPTKRRKHPLILESTMPRPTSTGHLRPSCPLPSSESGRGWGGERRVGRGEKCNMNEVWSFDTTTHFNY